MDDEQLFRVHRTIGYPVGYSRLSDGSKAVILQTSAYQKYEVAPAHLMIPVSDHEVRSEIGFGLISLVRRAAFLGVIPHDLSDLFQEALGQFQEEALIARAVVEGMEPLPFEEV